MNRKSFWLHFRPRTVRASAMRLTYTWGMGGMAAALVFLLMVTGMMLKFVYIPTPADAYPSVLAMNRTVPFGGFIRNMHHWSANLLVLIVFLHMLRVFFTGAYVRRRRINWVIGLCLFGCILAANFTGYLLPWDQLAYWAVTVSTAMLAYFPWIGDWLRETVLGGGELGAETLRLFFAIHTGLIPALLFLVLPLHFWRIRKAGGLASRGELNSDFSESESRIEVFPHLIVRELAMAAAVVASVLVAAALWDAPLGPEANPGLSPNPTKAPWYFAGLQEMLLQLHPFLAVVIIPLLTVAALTALPFLDRAADTSGAWFISSRGRHLSIVSALIGGLLTGLWVLGHAAGFAFLAWSAPLIGIGAAAAICLVFRIRFGASFHELVQGVFTFLLAVFILLTVTGIWFRGPSMRLMWPGQ